ncbi:MAG: hypothetical protein ACYC61_01540 [Isosphaeraceae bacterium]
MRRTIILTPIFVAIAALPSTARAQDPDASRRVVIPFDFESKFDDGEYGRTIGDMFWAKLHRQGGFILPESMQDVRDWCQRSRMLPGPETSLARMREVVAREQAGDIGIWGKVERVAGFESDVYDLWITVADFSVDPPRMIYQKKARTKTVSEIPHVYVAEALDALYGRSKPAAVPPDPALAARWKKFPSLVPGDFEQGGTTPTGWGPLPHDVTWVTEKGDGGKSRNRVIRFTLNEDVAGSTGVLYYSDYFPVEAGATYRFQCRWKTSGSAAKVFIKCYDELPTDFRDGSGGKASRNERREVYRSQQNLEGGPGAWNVHTEDFKPAHPRFTPRWGRVMLYAYWPAGTVEWDDIAVKRIAPAPGSKGKNDRRSAPVRRNRKGGPTSRDE